MAILGSVYSYLNSAATFDQQMDEFNDMTRLLTGYKGSNMISKLRLYVPGNKRYSNQNDTFFSLDSLIKSGNLLELDNAVQKGTQWLEPHDLVMTFGDAPVTVVSCETAVSSSINYEQVIGVLFLDLKVAQFNQVLSSGISQDELLFLVNGAGNILMHPDQSKIGQQAFPNLEQPAFPPSSAGNATIEIDGVKTMLVYTKLDSNDWYVVMTMPWSRILSAGIFSLDMIRLSIMLVIVLSFFFSLILIYKMVVESTLLRINNAIDTLQNEGIEPIERQQGTVTLINHKNKPSSLATLEKNANRMVMTIKALLDHQYKDQLAVRDFQMQALQAQINPHFLYNTLDVIKWMIIDNEKDDSVWMVNALSKYFRLSISKGRDIVQIQEEISLTQTYLGIMQKRFKNIFTTEFDVDPDLNECLIPKLSLQPVIENALLHGILYSEKPNQVLTIRVLREGNQIAISVEDNGNGINEETLQSIRDGNIAGKSYGLSNVRARLELFGADPASGFEIHAKEGIGTCVTLRFPVKYEVKKT